MNHVRAKKHLGQHFLLDENVSERIANEVMSPGLPSQILEIGPGTGALTKYLFAKPEFDVKLAELDLESVEYLKAKYPSQQNQILHADFLHMDLNVLFSEKSKASSNTFTVVGNFPYNISTQILFRVLEHRNQVPLVVGMFQKEVAKRIASVHGNREYGILSVFMQTFYKLEYLFDVPASSFNPPPKVTSGVIRCDRIVGKELTCSESMFFKVVKTAFNQRRKTLRNALKSILPATFSQDNPLLDKRAEQLSPQEFELLACQFEKD